MASSSLLRHMWAKLSELPRLVRLVAFCGMVTVTVSSACTLGSFILHNPCLSDGYIGVVNPLPDH